MPHKEFELIFRIVYYLEEGVQLLIDFTHEKVISWKHAIAEL